MRPLLLTFGATRNPVDAMRFLSAASSGRTGLWLAERFPDAHLLGGSEACLRVIATHGSERFALEEFGSTYDLLERMERWVTAHPTSVVVHAAAVGDYAVPDPSGKIPSGQPEIHLRLVPTPKILDRIRTWSHDARIISFKAAPPGTPQDELAAIADRQRTRTGSALVFGNVLGALDTCTLVDEEGATHFTTRDRALEALADRIAGLRA